MKKITLILSSVLCLCALFTACHRHTFAQEWKYNSEYHWHEATCGHSEVDGQSLHDMENGVCTVCGYGTHTHTYEDEYTYNDVYHWYASSCGHDVVSGKNYHNFESDVCVDCGYEYHAHTYETEWSYDENYHWYASTCEHEFAVKDKAAHTVVNGVCTTCGKESESVIYEQRSDGSYKLKRYIGDEEEYEIPSTYNSKAVVEIAPDAFAGCVELKKISVPNSVKYIGIGAFYGCTSLGELTLPFVGDSAYETRWGESTLFGRIFGTDYYEGGTSVKQETISKVIEYYIPTALKKVTVTGGVVYCGAFRNCTMLTTVVLPQNATTIEDETFYSCTSLTTLTIPSTVTYVGRESFYACISLGSVTIPQSAKTIRDKAFYGCEVLTDINIPASVTAIGKLVFGECFSLGQITVDSANTKYESINGVVYDEEKTQIVAFPSAYDGQLELPSTLTSFDAKAFEFSYGLTSVSIGSDSELYSSQGGILYDKEQKEILLVPKRISGVVTVAPTVVAIPNGAFYDCSQITQVVLPQSVTSIGMQSFSGCKKLNKIVLPSALKGISIGAFYQCESLESIVVPSTVTFIGDYAFDACALLHIYLEVEEEVENWDDYWSLGMGGGVYYASQWEYVNGVPTPKAAQE